MLRLTCLASHMIVIFVDNTSGQEILLTHMLIIKDALKFNLLEIIYA